MSFLNPFLFVALITAAIPVIIHLINFRKPRKVDFSTLVFFQELQKSTIRRINLKKYLLLATRILAISMLVIALARPFLPPDISGWLGLSTEQQRIAFLIDNGPSMMQIDESGPYADQVHSVAEQIISQASDGTRFIIVPTHGELESGRWMRKAETLSHLEQIKPVNKGGYPNERMKLIQDRLRDEPGEAGRIYWLSDARKTQLEKIEKGFITAESESEYQPVTFIKIGDDTFQNIAVESVSLAGHVLGEGIPAGVLVTVRNFGDQAVHNTYLSLEMNGERIGQYEVNLQAGQEKEHLFEVIPSSAGSIRGKAILEGGTYTFDHIRYFSLEVPESRKVLLVSDKGEDATRRSYVKPVLDAVSETSTRIHTTHADIRELREYDLTSYDAIILESVRRIPDYLQAEFIQFVQKGRGLLFIPSEQGDIGNYSRFLQQFNGGTYSGMRGDYGRFEEIASFQPLRDGHILVNDLFETRDNEEVRIDMPSIYHYLQYKQADSHTGSTVLSSNLGDPLFVEHSFGDGMIMVGMIGLSPGWSNISIKPLYAPLMYRMMLYIVSWEHGGVREHILGNTFDRQIPDFGTNVTMVLNGMEIRPEAVTGSGGIRIRYPSTEWSPGWLDLDLDGKKYTIAVNQDILESNFASLSTSETKSFLEKNLPIAGVISVSGYNESEIHSAMASISYGRELWKWFIWLALAFMVAECITSRMYKTETSSD